MELRDIWGESECASKVAAKAGSLWSKLIGNLIKTRHWTPPHYQRSGLSTVALLSFYCFFLSQILVEYLRFSWWPKLQILPKLDLNLNTAWNQIASLELCKFLKTNITPPSKISNSIFTSGKTPGVHLDGPLLVWLFRSRDQRDNYNY